MNISNKDLGEILKANEELSAELQKYLDLGTVEQVKEWKEKADMYDGLCK